MDGIFLETEVNCAGHPYGRMGVDPDDNFVLIRLDSAGHVYLSDQSIAEIVRQVVAALKTPIVLDSVDETEMVPSPRIIPERRNFSWED